MSAPITQAEIDSIRLQLLEQRPGNMSLRMLIVEAYLKGVAHGLADADYETVRLKVNQIIS